MLKKLIAGALATYLTVATVGCGDDPPTPRQKGGTEISQMLKESRVEDRVAAGSEPPKKPRNKCCGLDGNRINSIDTYLERITEENMDGFRDHTTGRKLDE